jgi:hypothetical protein
MRTLMDRYRPEVQAALSISLADQNAEIGPVATSGGAVCPTRSSIG